MESTAIEDSDPLQIFFQGLHPEGFEKAPRARQGRALARSARNESAQRPRDEVSHALRRVTHRLRNSERLVSVVAREEFVSAVSA